MTPRIKRYVKDQNAGGRAELSGRDRPPEGPLGLSASQRPGLAVNAPTYLGY
jgi:hypothetical protein